MTQEKSFEEIFPSLKGLKQGDGNEFTSFYGYAEEDIKENCFDKQKVREAIDKHLSQNIVSENLINIQLKKELGL